MEGRGARNGDEEEEGKKNEEKKEGDVGNFSEAGKQMRGGEGSGKGC